MQESQQVLQKEYKARKHAQLLLGSEVFPQFLQVYRSEMKSLEFFASTAAPKTSSFWSPLSTFRKKQSAFVNSEIDEARKMIEKSQPHLEILNEFAPDSLVAKKYFRRLAIRKDELAKELYPYGTGYADHKYIGFGFLGLGMIWFAKFLLNKVGFKIAGVSFLAGTALCCVALWHCFRGSKPINNLDEQVIQEVTALDKEIKHTLSDIDTQQANTGSSLMQETDLTTTINNIKLCQTIYNEQYLPAMQLAKQKEPGMSFG